MGHERVGVLPRTKPWRKIVAELAKLSTDFTNTPSPLRIAQALRTWVGGHQDSLEYRSIAERAATDAVMAWHSRQREQGYLFGPPEDAADVWGRASNGAGFCELSRLFFAKFTER